MDNTLVSAIALDLGTTSIKAALMDRRGNLHHLSALPAPAINSRDGCYESDALDYVNCAEEVLRGCAVHARTKPKPPLGLCSQRSSFLIWDKTSGQPVTPLISWQDNRGARYRNRSHTPADDEVIQALTGLRLTAYYFAPKLSVLLQENPDWRHELIEGRWLVGTLDTFLIWRWTHGRHFVTDTSMAARTLLMDIHHRQWSNQLCRLFDVPPTVLPQIKSSTGLNIEIPNGFMLQASVGDQSAALIACAADNSDEALINLGTGGFVIRTLAPETAPLKSYLQTLVYQEENRLVRFAIEGTLNSITSALAPYPVEDCHFDELARSDIFCIAEPSGLGAPYFRQEWGIHCSESTAKLTAQQIAVLMLEAIIFRVTRILEDFHHHAPLSRAYLSGGLSELSCLQYGIAQCAPCPIIHVTQKETSLRGTALLASLHRIELPRSEEDIPIVSRNSALIRKYRRWKKWLDTLLETQHN